MLLPELPMQLVLHILELLPPNAQAYSGKLVNKAACGDLRTCTSLRASEDLPVWVIQQYLSAKSAEGSQQAFLRQLLNHRAAAGDLQGVMFLHSQGATWDCTTTAAAAGAGQLGLLLYLRAQNPPCDWDITTCTAAAAGGHLDVLQWCRSQHPPAPWGHSTAAAAATAGHLAVLQWLLKPHNPLGDVTNVSSHQKHQIVNHGLADSSSSTCGEPSTGSSESGGLIGTKARGGVQARPEACPWPPWVRCSAAAKAGQLHVLKWLRADGAAWDAGVCAAAAEAGHLHILQYLRSQNPQCPIDVDSCFEAACIGHLHILQYLKTQLPPTEWDESVCLGAAMGGHLEIMVWLRDLVPPCPWVFGTTAAATGSGNTALVQWLKAHGAP